LTEPLNGAAENTQIISGSDNILKITLEKFSKVKSTINSCIDAKAPITLVSKDLSINKILSEAKNKGIKLRYITEITEENISHCKEMMRIGIELRHIKGVNFNFGIADRREYITTLVQEDRQTPAQALVSNVKSFVEQQQYFFDTHWKKAIPAQDRIREIEEGSTHMKRLRDFIRNILKHEGPKLFMCENDDPPYVKNRLTYAIQDFQKSKSSSINREHDLQFVVIIASAIIPIANVSIMPSHGLNILSSFLGGIALVITSILQLKKYHERWILSKITAQKLMNEYYWWKSKVEPYNKSNGDDERLAVLVRNCESILMSETTQFVGIFQPRH
jgi:hypothetical protein